MKIILSVIAVCLVMITVEMYTPNVNANYSDELMLRNYLDGHYADKDHSHCGILGNRIGSNVSCKGHKHNYVEKRIFEQHHNRDGSHNFYFPQIPRSAYEQNQVELFKTLISKCKVNFNRTLSCEID